MTIKHDNTLDNAPPETVGLWIRRAHDGGAGRRLIKRVTAESVRRLLELVGISLRLGYASGPS
jgi:hypothetical protein